MSASEQDTLFVPWVGPLSYKNTLSVIVVSADAVIIQRISDALSEIHRKSAFRWKLIVLRAFHIDDVLKLADVTGKISIDFVVLAIDTSRTFCLEFTKNELDTVHPHLRSRRVILVNAGGSPANAMAISAGDLLALQSDYKLDMITANVLDGDAATFLAHRLLKFIEVSIGAHTGIPNLNV